MGKVGSGITDLFLTLAGARFTKFKADPGKVTEGACLYNRIAV